MRFIICFGLPVLLLTSGCAEETSPKVRQAESEDAGNDDTNDIVDDTDSNSTTEDTGEPSVEPESDVREICYLGDNRGYTTCLDAVPLASTPADYVYPSPLNGDPQYRAPEAYLDLTQVSPTLKLAPNFVADELAQEWKGRYAVVQPHAVERLQDLRDDLGALVVNSGYRNPDYNAGVGGATHSRHMYGDAFDLSPVSVSLGTLADACDDHGAGYVGVYESHIHCDWRDDAVDEDFFGASYRSAFRYIPDLDAEITEHDGAFIAPAWGWDEGEPLREWTAIGPNDEILATHIGRYFEPPPGTKGVEVVVGRAVLRRVSTNH